MSINIHFSPKDKTAFKNGEDIEPIAKIISEEIKKRRFYQGYASKFKLNLGENHFEIEFEGMIGKSKEDENYMVREISEFLDELGYSELLYISQIEGHVKNGDCIFDCKAKLATITRNEKLMKAYKISEDKVPEKFLCKLTQQFMDKAVYLKQNTEIKYDELHLKSWLFKHDKPHDPFTRITVTVTDIIVDEALNNEIKSFLTQAVTNSLKVKHQENEKTKTEQTQSDQEEKIKLNQIVARCKLNDASPKSLEKGARYAAAKNYVDDLASLIEKAPNAIDQQDDNETNKKTSLHWAAKNGSHECIKLLLDHKAKSDIPDFFKKTALDYAKEYAITHNDQKTLDLFEIKDVQLQQGQNMTLKNNCS